MIMQGGRFAALEDALQNYRYDDIHRELKSL
jgi:hypothetical protein